MGIGTFIHHIGTVLLLAATALLIVASITAPVVNDLSLLKVDLAADIAGGKVTFGTFGYCITENGHHDCTSSKVGYNPAAVMEQLENTSFSKADRDSSKDLTNVFVLHAVGAGISFLAFLLCLGTHFVGSFIASLLSLLAFVITIIVLACDFAVFEVIRKRVNDDNSGSTAHFGPAIWCVVGAAAATLIASGLVFITCCAGRRRNSRRRTKEANNGY